MSGLIGALYQMFYGKKMYLCLEEEVQISNVVTETRKCHLMMQQPSLNTVPVWSAERGHRDPFCSKLGNTTVFCQ